MWQSISSGILTLAAIESLMLTWADCGKETCQLLIGTGCLNNIADSFKGALNCETLASVSNY